MEKTTINQLKILVVLIMVVVGFYLIVDHKSQQALELNKEASLIKTVAEDSVPPEIIGTIYKTIFDDFDNPKNTRSVLFLKSVSGAEYNLSSDIIKNIKSGDVVEIKNAKNIDGYISGDIGLVEAEDVQITDTHDEEDADSIEDSYKVLVFLVKKVGEVEPFAKEKIYSTLFEGQTNNFIIENSYDKKSLSGEVHGWIDASSIACLAPYKLDESAGSFNIPEVKNYIAQNDIPIENYDHVIFGIRCHGTSGISTLGEIDYIFDNKNYSASFSTISINKEKSYSPAINTEIGFGQQFEWNNIDYLLVHELGHALGLEHANGLDCGSQTIELLENCQSDEYGNTFNVMGGKANYALQFGALDKIKLGWIDETQEKEVTTSGTYSISPLEDRKGIKYFFIKNPAIPENASVKNIYGLEFRKGVGFNKSLSFYPELQNNKEGLLLYVDIYHQELPGVLPDYGRRYILDGKPTMDDWLVDLQGASLEPKSIFIDDERGIAIKNVKESTDGRIIFDVIIDDNIPECIHKPVDIETYSPYTYSLSNPPSVDYNFIILTNVDETEAVCGESNFAMEITPQDGVLSKYNFDLNLALGINSYLPIGTGFAANGIVKINPETEIGEYKYILRVKNTTHPEGPTAEKEIIIKIVP